MQTEVIWCAQNPQFGDWEEPPFQHDDDDDNDDDDALPFTA